MATAISTVMPMLRLELTNCPDIVIEDVLFRVLRRFFWESEAWKYTYDNGLDWTLNTPAMPSPVAGTDIPTKTVVKRVDTVKYSSTGDDWDEEVPFLTRDELDRLDPDWQTATGANPEYWTYDDGMTAVITPQATATVTTGLLIRSIIAPVFTTVADTLPDNLYYEFEEAFKEGVLAELKKIPGKDWSDPVAAARHASTFGAWTVKAKSRAEAGYGQPSGVMAYGGI